MTSHIGDQIAAMLRGEAEPVTATAAAAHLRHCEDCVQELISGVVAHAALESAVPFPPDLVALAHPGADSAVLSDSTPPQDGAGR